MLLGTSLLAGSLTLVLCDNAIRYNIEGGKVEVNVNNDGEHTVLTVKAMGICIPIEHQGWIFERFYRVDKSHSKETGGTGLGLSIVKYAVSYYVGKISFEALLATERRYL